jgi:hypothetical protein
MKRALILLPITLILFGCENPAPQPGATSTQTLYFGGDIITMQGAQPEYVEAVIVRDGKIAYAGDREGAVTDFEGDTIYINSSIN